MSNFASLPSSRYSNTLREDSYDRSWRLIQWAGSGKHVLELGCSTGYISQRLVENGCEVIGIEIDSEVAEHARRFCSSVLVTDLNGTDWINCLKGQTFDVILMGDVLEHLVNPDKILRAVGTLLRPSGCLLLSLPNVVHWITRLEIFVGRFDYEPAGTLDCSHLRFFTLKAARALIEDAGYRITAFHPAIGGRLSGQARPVWQWLASRFPGLFAYQLLFEAKI
jgi:2-polyprenyl-3-methyl-5-hydroxy-6-metoxy-1,4-benzoquinol methylase